MEGDNKANTYGGMKVYSTLNSGFNIENL